MPNSSCQLPVKWSQLEHAFHSSFSWARASVYVHWSNLLRMRHAYFILFACLARYYRPTWRMINIKWQRQCTLPAILKQSGPHIHSPPPPPPDFHLLLSANLAFQLINIICWHITRSPVRRGRASAVTQHADFRHWNFCILSTYILWYVHGMLSPCNHRADAWFTLATRLLLHPRSLSLSRDAIGACCCWVFNVFDWSWHWRRTALNVWQSVSYCV